MVLLVFLIITEVLTPVVYRQHLFKLSRVKYYILIIVHAILSMWLWILFFKIYSYRGFYDNPQNVWMHMNMAGMIAGVVFPRIVLIIMHFTGVFIRRREEKHIPWLTNTGIIAASIIFLIIGLSTLIGRFNFKTENVTISIKELPKDLDGLKIVHLSDLHLPGFHHHRHVLKEVMEKVNSFNPDMIINTGDFITYGWREFAGFDTILSIAVSRYGNYAIMGNHDAGTYHPYYTEGDLVNNELWMNKFVESSGYTVLNDEFSKVKIGNTTIAMIGVKTSGRHPDILHGDIEKAITRLDSADFKILLTHDPNHWEEDITGKTDIDLTLSGHTHGMQMGILTKKFRWSPSKYFYPNWNGHYSEGSQHQYVNRGLGMLAIPFRIWMPPEITVITLASQ